MEHLVSTPPQAPQRPHVHRVHGVEHVDPYHGLCNLDDPEVKAYIAAENAHTQDRLARLEPLRRQVHEELRSRMAEDEVRDIVPDGPFTYYERMAQGRPYPLHCRRPTAGGPEQVLVDPNELPESSRFLVVYTYHSPDHRLLAVAVDTTGGERFELRFRDLDTGAWLADRIEGASAWVAWATDGRTVLWCALDPSLRPYRIHRHLLGTWGPDPVVYEELDDRRWVWSTLSTSREWILLESSTRDSNEVHLLPAATPAAPPRCLQPRQPGLRYQVCCAGGQLWILTSDCEGPDGVQTAGAANGWLATADPQSTSKADWATVGAHRPDVHLISMVGFSRHLAIVERHAGQLRIRIRALETGDEHLVAMPDALCKVGAAPQLEYDTPWLRIAYTSLSTPATVFRYHMDTRELVQVWQRTVPHHDPSDYRSWRRQATAPDGATVYLSLIARTDVVPDADTPLVVFGYGAYGSTVDPEYMPPWTSFLQRGGVFAIAHVRGGGYLGRAWYEAGKMANKPNTASDLVAAVRSLHAAGIGRPETTLLHGSSGGGLMIGPALNQAPGLCAAVYAAVPFVDLLAAMLDPSLPLTTSEYEEWGDPRDPEVFHRMRSYCPYENVRAQAYPDMLVVAAQEDPRVPCWGPVKWVARLRERATAGEFLVVVRSEAGHAGAPDRYRGAEASAQYHAWVLDRLGLAQTPLRRARTISRSQ
jgi:oligopeptidase B